jgi:hypothetical protein
MNRHPVIEDTIVFGTKPLQECVDIFKDRMSNGDRGMMIHAPPKQGVSTVCRHICASMRSASTAVVVFAQAVRPDDLPLSRQADSLWGQLIPANAAVKSYVRNLRDVLERYIEVEADRLQTKHVVFAVDRAENLSIHQWDALKILLESLRSRQKLSCFALLAGQSELLSLPRRMNRRLRHALVAEFFVGQCRLRGVLLDELHGVLEWYDATRFPLPEGPTYTEHFCPSLWGRGIRLTSYSSVMRDSFEKLFQASGTGAVELGMEYVAAAARRFLLGAESVAAEGSADFTSLAQSCVAQCGLRERLMLLGNPEADAMDRELAPRKGWQ